VNPDEIKPTKFSDSFKKLISDVMKEHGYSHGNHYHVSYGTHQSQPTKVYAHGQHVHVNFTKVPEYKYTHGFSSLIPADKLDALHKKYTTKVVLRQTRWATLPPTVSPTGKPGWMVEIIVCRQGETPLFYKIGRYAFSQQIDWDTLVDRVHLEFYDRTTGELRLEMRGEILQESSAHHGPDYNEVLVFGNECLCSNSSTLFG